MAKFCGNCGAQLDDDDKVCGQCGTPVNGNAGTVPGLKVVDPEKKKKMAKRIKWIVALVIVVALAITVSEGLSQLHRHKWSCPQGYDSL